MRRRDPKDAPGKATAVRTLPAGSFQTLCSNARPSRSTAIESSWQRELEVEGARLETLKNSLDFVYEGRVGKGTDFKDLLDLVERFKVKGLKVVCQRQISLESNGDAGEEEEETPQETEEESGVEEED